MYKTVKWPIGKQTGDSRLTSDDLPFDLPCLQTQSHKWRNRKQVSGAEVPQEGWWRVSWSLRSSEADFFLECLNAAGWGREAATDQTPSVTASITDNLFQSFASCAEFDHSEKNYPHSVVHARVLQKEWGVVEASCQHTEETTSCSPVAGVINDGVIIVL